MWKRALYGVFDLLSPPSCAACTTRLPARALGFCPACRPLIEPLPHPLGEPFDSDACVYGGPLRDALHRLKYEGASDIVGALVPLLHEHARALHGRIDVVTSVPLHPKRLRERGYNQSALLARALASPLGVPCAPRLLTRSRATAAQVGKNRHDRAVQLSLAIKASKHAAGARVLVIDDVRTTGATLAECRRALLAAQAAAVYTLALACAPASDESELDDL